MQAKQGDKKGTKSLSQVLNVHRDVFERARTLLPTLPEGPARGATPATLAEAQAQINERLQSQAAGKDPKSKSKAGPAQPAEPAVPGARIGGASPHSAFWTLVEVSRAPQSSSRGEPMRQCMPAPHSTAQLAAVERTHSHTPLPLSLILPMPPPKPAGLLP